MISEENKNSAGTNWKTTQMSTGPTIFKDPEGSPVEVADGQLRMSDDVPKRRITSGPGPVFGSPVAEDNAGAVVTMIGIVRSMRERLETHINDLIAQFEHNSGMKIQSINLDRHETHGGDSTILASIEL